MSRILIVDDDFTIKLELEEMLTARGYDIVGTAENGEQAIEMALGLIPDLILMDIVMPGGLDGISAAEKIKQESDSAIVFITGYGDPEYVERAKKVEPLGYVMKPFDEKEISAAVEIALYKREMELKLKEAQEQLEQRNRDLQKEIRDRRKTQEALFESEARYRQILNTAPAGIYEVDFIKQKFTNVNDAICEYTGYTREELLSMSPFDILTEDGKKVFSERLSNLFSGKKVPDSAEFKALRKDGTEFWALTNITYLYENEKLKGARVVAYDITDRKQAEEIIRKQEEKYRSLFENISIGIGIGDVKGNILDFNDAMLYPGGYSREDITKMGNLSEFYYDPNVRDKTLKKTFEQGFLDEEELQFKRKDGTPYDALLSLRPMQHEGKSCWQAMVQDVSDRKKAEEEIQKVRREWESIFQAIGHPTLILDGNHRLIHANTATEKATGKPEKELMGKTCYEIFHNTDEPPEGCPFEKMTTSRHLETIEMKIEALGGTFLVSCTPMLDKEGRIEKVIHIATDVTDRKKAEEALRKSQKKYRDLVENINDVIFALDITGNVSYVSPAIEKIVGYSPSEITGRNMMEFIHPDDRARLADRFKELLTSGVLQPYEYRLTGKSGNICWVKSSSRPIFQDGKTIGIQGVVIDITESKRLEEQLRQAHKMEAISTLTGGIAHDYNNLLAIIMGNLSMIREEAEPHSVIAGFLHEVEQASSKARDLTHQLMTLSRGGYPMKELGSIESLLKEIPGQIQAHDGIEYAFSIQDDLWPVEFDSRQMHYAINNVIINAVEAMPQGGKITIQAENQAIENQSKDSALPLNEGKYVRISIKDEGRGIAEKHLNRIFDPYFSTKERGAQKGMGMGLTTAYAVVQKHGGHIMLDSKTGAGTTVTIYLPAAEEIEKEKSTRQKSDDITPSISGVQPTIQRILVMDDEEMLRNLAQKMLERLGGYKVETVKDGVEAIETYKNHMDSGEPFDGVILDLTIKGGMGGAQAIKELIKIDPDVKAIVCSGYFNDPVLAHFEEHGFRGAMAKPYQKADLESVLKTIL